MAKKQPEIQYIAVEHIHPHPDNPRKDLGDLTELTESIKKNGIMQNLTVIPAEKEGEYTALIGHRRLAAAKAAKLLTVPCKVVQLLTPGEQVAIMLEENMQRNDLTIIEQAQGFQMMLDLGSSVDEIAKKTGFSEQTVKHRLKIAQLDPKAIAKAEEDGYFQLTIKHFTMLEKLPTVEMRNEVLADSRDGRQLEMKIRGKLDDIERSEKAGAIIAVLTENGIKAAPKNTHTWSSGYATVTTFYLGDELPKDIMQKLRGKDVSKLSYIRESLWIYVVEKRETASVKQENKKEKYNERRKKQARALQKDLEAQRREMIMRVVRGTYWIIPGKEELPLVEELIRTAIGAEAWISYRGIAEYLYGGDWYSLKDEERDEYLLQAKTLPAMMQMLVCADRALQLRTGTDQGCIITWDGKKRTAEIKRIYELHVILEEYYGWEIPDAAEQLADGTHPIFRTYEEAVKDGDAE